MEAYPNPGNLPDGKTTAVNKVPRIKVCGMTSLDQMHLLGEIGVQFAGMIFYHKSPRFVMRHLKGFDVKRAKLKVFKIGVFVNSSYDEVMNHIDNFGLDMVQLHGDETPYYCSKLSDYISVIKAFRITESDNIEWKVKSYYDDTDMFMFDTEGAGYGGTGKKFNWTKLKGSRINKPFFLSGGIEPEDDQSIKEFLNEEVAKDLFAVDINSRFEIAPGLKDMDKVNEFVKKLNEP
ncbi:MAG: phosphoribosylanthranilate isomerase [Segetibacter sp.]|nr:phosphoribosylanthranilate isomerase [Segetibacter sp.]